MTVSHEVNQHAEVEPTTSKNRAQQPVKRRSVSFVIGFMMLIMMGCTGYVVYIAIQLRQGATQQFHSVQKKIGTISAEQVQIDKSIDVTNQRIVPLQTQVNLIDKRLQILLQQQSYKVTDWTLLKARYYLELAQMNAYWSDNIDATDALLSQADALLATVHEPRVFSVRGAIATEKNSLHAIEKVDIAGVLTQLDAAAELSSQIPVHQVHSILAGNNAEKTPTLEHQPISSWSVRLKESLAVLEKLVVVRRVDSDIQPVVSAAYVELVRENVGLILQEAQWAVLQRNEVIYQLTLRQAIKKITQSFDLQAVKTQTLLQQLHDLQKVQLTQRKFQLGKSALLLNQLIDLKPISVPEGPNGQSGVSGGDKPS